MKPVTRILCVLILIPLFGVLVAYFFAADRTQGIALFGATVACCKVLYDALNTEYERWKKERENRERIQTSLSFRDEDEGSVIVHIYNESSTHKVNIRKVEMIAENIEGASICRYVANLRLHRASVTEGAYHPRWTHDKTFLLEPKGNVEFKIYGRESVKFTPSILLALEPQKLRIVVHSFAGELATINGEAIQRALREGLSAKDKLP